MKPPLWGAPKGWDGDTDWRDGLLGVADGDLLGAENDREPLLPMERPPPALAAASLSSI